MFLSFLDNVYPFSSSIFLSDLLCFLSLYFYFTSCCPTLFVTCVAYFFHVSLFCCLFHRFWFLSSLSVDFLMCVRFFCRCSFTTCCCQQEASMWSFLVNIRPKETKIITSHDVLEPLKQTSLASRDVIVSGQMSFFFTLGDGYWLPMLVFHYCCIFAL